MIPPSVKLELYFQGEHYSKTGLLAESLSLDFYYCNTTTTKANLDLSVHPILNQKLNFLVNKKGSEIITSLRTLQCPIDKLKTLVASVKFYPDGVNIPVIIDRFPKFIPDQTYQLKISNWFGKLKGTFELVSDITELYHATLKQLDDVQAHLNHVSQTAVADEILRLIQKKQELQSEVEELKESMDKMGVCLTAHPESLVCFCPNEPAYLVE